jgi:hypothetical protein
VAGWRPALTAAAAAAVAPPRGARRARSSATSDVSSSPPRLPRRVDAAPCEAADTTVAALAFPAGSRAGVPAVVDAAAGRSDFAVRCSESPAAGFPMAS